MTTRKPSQKQSSSLFSQYLWPIVAIIVGIGAGTLVLFWILNREETPLVQPASAEQLIATSALSAKVESVTEVPARELMTGNVIEGKKGLVVRLNITNNTSSEQHFLPAHHVFIKGTDDSLYQMAPVAGIAEPIVAGAVAPGETLTGDISFMINETETDSWLYIDPRWNDMSPVVIQLQK